MQIINLKRFQFLNGRWVKSHKIVKFPSEDFDPANYLAERSGIQEEDVFPQSDSQINQSKHSNHSHKPVVPSGRIRSTSCEISRSKSGRYL